MSGARVTPGTGLANVATGVPLLDHLLVEHVASDMVLLASGCLCCTVRGDLVSAFPATQPGRLTTS